MHKSEKILVLVILAIIIFIYLLSPPRTLTIKITATPQGVQEFYVVTSSRKFGLIHSGGSTRVDKRLVPVNQEISIPLDPSKMNWLNPISVQFHHPEYFGEWKRPNNRFILPKVQLKPISWADTLNNSPRWEVQPVSYEQQTEEYLADWKSHKIIFTGHVHGHINSMNYDIIKMYLRNSDADKLRKSVLVLERIVKEFDDAVLEGKIAIFDHSEYVQKQIGETHLELDKIHETIN